MKGVKQSEDLLDAFKNRVGRSLGKGWIAKEDADWLFDQVHAIEVKIEEIEESRK